MTRGPDLSLEASSPALSYERKPPLQTRPLLGINTQDNSKASQLQVLVSDVPSHACAQMWTRISERDGKWRGDMKMLLKGGLEGRPEQRVGKEGGSRRRR